MATKLSAASGKTKRTKPRADGCEDPLPTWHSCGTTDGVQFGAYVYTSHSQWEFQDPKMEVLYHIRPYFAGIFPYIGLKNRPYIW